MKKAAPYRTKKAERLDCFYWLVGEAHRYLVREEEIPKDMLDDLHELARKYPLPPVVFRMRVIVMMANVVGVPIKSAFAPWVRAVPQAATDP